MNVTRIVILLLLMIGALSSLALASAASRMRAVQVCAACLMLLGLYVSAGYALGDPEIYIWAGRIGMALPSAIAATITGACLLALARR